jgi:hypothetical protein
MAQNPLLTLTLTTITSMQLQIKQASMQTTSRPHHHATSKQNYCMQNVLVSLQICEIKNQKEWHWPPKKKKIYIYIYSHYQFASSSAGICGPILG